MRSLGSTVLACAMLAGCIPASGGRDESRYDPPPRSPPLRSPPPGQERPEPARAPQVPASPAPRPAWEARPVSPDARRIEAGSYVVRAGDSLRSVARKTGAGAEAIARANTLAKPYAIVPGQVLAVPAGRYHAVREGETGIAIARAYAVAWSRVISANDLEEPYVLRPGQRLLIPDTGVETREQRAARFHLDIDDIVTGGTPAVRETAKPARSLGTASRAAAARPIAVPERLIGQFRWPVAGTVVRRFGPGKSGERNDGIKIAVPLETPVLAAADGIVAYAGSDVPALGGLVILRHGDGWTTVYGHAGQLLVERGQSVKRGQTVALSGKSGFADRPEVHFEMRKGRIAVDPLPKLPPR